MRNLLLFPIFVALAGCQTSTYVVELESSLTSDEEASHSFSITYAVEGNRSLTKWGAYEITFPTDLQANDTALALEHFGAFPAGGGRIPLLLANLKTGNPTIYIDHNNNSDFSDDGAPVCFSSEDSSAILRFHDPENPKAVFAVEYFMENIDEDETAYLDRLFATGTLRDSGLPVLHPQHWFYTKRYNNRKAMAQIDGEAAKVVLHDYNCNGYFDDEGEDRIFVAPPDVPFTARKSSGSFEYYKDSSLFMLDSQVYKVLAVDSLGRSLKIKATDQPFDPPVAAGQKMPNLSFTLLNGKDTSLASFINGEKYLLLDFWGAWCKGCHYSAPAIKDLSDEYSGKLQVVGLNSGEALENIQNFTQRYGHDWPQGMVSSELKKSFLVDGYPTYVLIDPEGTIINLKSYPQQIEEVLSSAN